ncbi:MAG: response regulator transcription factor [Acidobacteriaceae bacterium]|nr:response regulator transcription factor [Acidobacteriaceae bacterium]MBV9501394.1 response regulator transcription factor [Acidobacteriaceae bacterium]
MQKILIVDDDPELRETVSILLERERFVPLQAVDGQSALEKAFSMKPNLMLVDLRLPGMSGIEVCKQLRANRITTPIIILSAIGDEVDKVLLLEIGADDYVVKPFGTRELLARIRAVLRRSSDDGARTARFGEVEVDIERRTVRRNNKEVKVTPAEYNLLLFFLQNAERVLTRDLILNSVWGYEYYPNTRTVDAHVVRLRQKFEQDPAAPTHFVTVHGVGYRFLP